MSDLDSENKKISIAHVVTGDSFGGVEGHICTLIKVMKSSRFSFSVICDNSVKSEFERRLEGTEASVISVLIWPSPGFGSYRDMIKVFRDLSPDIVHNHLYSATRIASLAAKLAGVPKIIETIHIEEVWRKGFKKFLYCSVDAAIGRVFVDGYIAVSEAVSNYYKRNKWVPERKLTTIYNTTNHEAGNVEERVFTYRLGFLGRLVPQKGLDVLLKAMKILKEDGKSPELWIGGTGPLEAELKSLASKLKVYDSVRFLGQVREPASFFNSIDIFVLPSRFEGFPLVLLEAGMYRKPVVATNVSGNPEIIRHEKTGLLAEPENERSLADMLKVFENDEIRTSCAENLKKLIEDELSRKQYRKRMTEYYESLT